MNNCAQSACTRRRERREDSQEMQPHAMGRERR